MNTSPKSETLDRLKALVNAHVADPNVRLEITFAAIEYGGEQRVIGIEQMSDAWPACRRCARGRGPDAADGKRPMTRFFDAAGQMFAGLVLVAAIVVLFT